MKVLSQLFCGTIIEGTLRNEDLIAAFLNVLNQVNPERVQELRDEYGITTTAPYMASAFEEQYQSNYLLTDLMDELDYVAPFDTWFGAHPGDGSDFGFWPTSML